MVAPLFDELAPSVVASAPHCMLRAICFSLFFASALAGESLDELAKAASNFTPAIVKRVSSGNGNLRTLRTGVIKRILGRVVAAAEDSVWSVGAVVNDRAG